MRRYIPMVAAVTLILTPVAAGVVSGVMSDNWWPMICVCFMANTGLTGSAALYLHRFLRRKFS